MTIKHLGGVFGRNPTFYNVTIEGQLIFEGGIDINSDLTVDGAVTADGLTVESGATNIGIVTKSTDQFAFIGFEDNTSSASSVYVGADGNDFIARANSLTRFRAASNGDVSLYEDTGTTAKFFWDASEERLGLRTSDPKERLDISGGGIRLDDSNRISWSSSDSNIGRVRIIGNESNDTISFFTDNSKRLEVSNTGVDVTGSVTTTGGVVFGTTGGNVTSKTLDDYEEGTFTPVVADASSGGNTATLTSATGTYVKVGNLVTVQIFCVNITTTGMTGANAVHVRGLPFTSDGGTYAIGALVLTSATFTGSLSARVQGGNTYFTLIESRSGLGADNVQVQDLTSGTSDIHATITYFI